MRLNSFVKLLVSFCIVGVQYSEGLRSLNLRGIKRDFYFTTDKTVSELKWKLAELGEGSPTGIFLIFGREKLTDDRTLDSYGITKDSLIYVVERNLLH
ncbi:hypothetical protein WR25_12743 [Diploscapter pachys]|uniref:Ubiquitin-like domain-containing protein n=1 Tax=Diploscapter pachys TaxID=2018661 RepID=A0A2A2JVP9_9BILA|nr:hypothetical protein WR25_12743 [Diploscapter pachys]